MARGLNIRVDGLKELQKKLGKLPKELVEQIDMEMEDAAGDYVERSVSAAPVDTGMLRNGISYKKLAIMSFEIVSAAPYSAYQEFGWGIKTSIPAGLEDFAAQFKGKGLRASSGSPQPFFFPQRGPVMEALNKALGPAVKRALEK